MPKLLNQSIVNRRERETLIQSFPCFAKFSHAQKEKLVSFMEEVAYEQNEMIVAENELIDSIFIIVKGEAEVTREVKQHKKVIPVPVALLRPTEGIGINDTGFYSSTGKRTATVTALTEMLLLRLDLKDLYGFLQQNNLEVAMYAASKQMLAMRFIKQSLPFAKLSHERLMWLAERIEAINLPANTVIFKQGDEGDKCYLIRKGRVAIISIDENKLERQIALLKPPVLFGEATLITHSPRNATAKTLEDCELLMLSHQFLSELIESEENVAQMFMTLMVDRSRPIQNLAVSVHQRLSADGQEITILKNPHTGSYFKLSKEGTFIWHQLDGKHTMQDITLNLADEYNVFAPDVVAALISKLTKAGFISNLEIDDDKHLSTRPFWVRAMVKIQRLLEVRYAFGDADAWISRIYKKYIKYLFTKGGQAILSIIAILGISIFVIETHHVLQFFSHHHASLLLILLLIPLSLVVTILHELGHAFAVKAFDREVHYIGVGWYWFAPIAFTDTSDMWLSTRKPRMLVNLAGIYVDVIMASLSALLILIFPYPYIQGMLWLFALYTYIGAFRNLSPLQEMDGYYVLMDWIEKNRLRQASVLWLIKIFPQTLRHPHLFSQYKAEVTYWIACLIYLIFVTAIVLIVQAFVLKVLGIQTTNPYFTLILPFLIVAFSCISIIAEIRNQREE